MLFYITSHVELTDVEKILKAIAIETVINIYTVISSHFFLRLLIFKGRFWANKNVTSSYLFVFRKKPFSNICLILYFNFIRSLIPLDYSSTFWLENV